MKIHVLDPLIDSRWDEFVARHSSASVFHDRGWLKALARTYGYELYALTSAPFGRPLENGVVVCRVSSWVTGARLVSLPFSDHCEPLLHEGDAPEEFIFWMLDACELQKWKYVEIRPLSAQYGANNGLQPSQAYWFHELDLSANLSQIFRRTHKDSIQRRIQRAEREGLSCEVGRSEELMNEFYQLLLKTRRRHHLFPQPRTWFGNLLECMRDKLQIRVARKNRTPVAALLTLRHGASVVYKYGCSDEKFHHLGVMPFLFWKLIEESKASGVQKIDFGRTDLNNSGLVTFKDRFGTNKRLLTYYRYAKTDKPGAAGLAESQALHQFLAFLPETVCCAAGKILYRHFG